MNPLRTNRSPYRNGSQRCERCFTLLELLLVVSIMGIVAAFVVPNIVSIVRNVKITQGGQMTENLLQSARQRALSTNRTIEVRFYNFVNSSFGQSASYYQALQPFSLVSGSYTAIDKPHYLPTGIIMDSGSGVASNPLTTMLSGSLPIVTGTSGSPTLGSTGFNYTYAAFQFKPDGSTNMSPTGSWFLTLHNSTDGNNRTTPPPNYYTIQIDPSYGHVIDFHP